MDERTQWMRALQMYGLALFDLHLFLDTHPTDQNALAYYTNYQTLYAQTMTAYVAKYGPIEASQYNGSGTWQWIDSPWPWEN